MPQPVSTLANLATAKALFQTGASIRSVAKTLGVSPYSAWTFKHQDHPAPELVHSVSTTLADRMTLASSAAVDVLLDKALDGKLDEERAIDLAKMSSILAQSAGAYAALSGAKDTMSAMFSEFGISQSHSASRVTLEQKITVESTPQPVVVNGLENGECE